MTQTLGGGGTSGLVVFDETTQTWIPAKALSSGVIVVATAGGAVGSAVDVNSPIGQSAMAAAVSVVIASDQTAIPVTLGGGGLTPSSTFVATAAGIPLAVTGPLTDAELRASPVTVQGTVTASGPLTNAELRATPVPVSASPSGTPTSTFVAGSVSLVGIIPVLGSVGITNAVTVNPPVVQLVGFGLSSATMGQKTMSLSLPVVMASDAPPMPNAGRVQITNPPALVDGANAPLAVDALGKQVVTMFAGRGLTAMGTCMVSGTGETVLIPAQGSTVFADMVTIILANSHSTIPARIQLRGALTSSVVMTFNLNPNETNYVAFTRPLEAPARNMAWTIQKALVGGSCYVSAQVVKIV